ncbi:MAG: IPT/TIG domain-containing protein, partial [Planctomycetota bacterium]
MAPRRLFALVLVLVLVAPLALLHVACGSASTDNAPVLLGVDPGFGPPEGGTEVVLRCKNAETVFYVAVNGVEAPFYAFVRDEAIRCDMPPGDAGPADVTVVTGGGSTTLVGGFLYLPAGTWLRQDGGPGAVEARRVVTLHDGGCLVTGTFDGSATFGAGETNETTLVSAGGRDAFLAAYTLQGTLRYAVHLAAGAGEDRGLGLDTFGDGACLVTGRFEGETVFGPGQEGEVTLTSAGEADAFVARVDAGGSVRWVRRIGGPGDDGAERVAALPDGSGVLAGWFCDTATLEGGVTGNATRTSRGGTDVFLAGYGSAGGLAWVAQAGGTQDDATRALAV